MDSRSSKDAEKKKVRSDGCDVTSCKFRDDASGKCAFETCLREELPPLQQPTLQTKCIFCGKTMTIGALDAFGDDRICDECRTKVGLWVEYCDAVLDHGIPDHPIR